MPEEGAARRASRIGDEFEASIEKAQLDGNKLAFEIDIAHGKVAFDGTVVADEMKFTVTGTQGDKYSLVCKRQE